MLRLTRVHRLGRGLAWALLITANGGCGGPTAPHPSASPGVHAAPSSAISSSSMSFASPADSAVPLVTPRPAGPLVTITRALAGKIAEVHVGGRILVKLGSTLHWAVGVGDPDVLARVRSVVLVHGAQAFYVAVRASVTKIYATGGPACHKSNRPCATPSLAFDVTVVVRP